MSWPSSCEPVRCTASRSTGRSYCRTNSSNAAVLPICASRIKCVSSTRAGPTFARCDPSCNAFSTCVLSKVALANEFVPRAMHRQNEPRIFRLRLNLLPQAHDMCIHRARSGESVVSPHLLQQTVTRQRLSRMMEEKLQQLELFGREIKSLAFARHLAAAKIDLDFAKCVPLLLFRNASRAPQDSLHARQQLANRERLRHVVVGAQFEP